MSQATTLRTALSRLKRKLIKGIYRQADQMFDTDYYIRYKYHLAGYHNPNYAFRKDQISFIHIPKTGGTSLAKMLRAAPGDTFLNLNIHRPISQHCPPAEYRYITLLREPVSRVWSYYQMVLREYEGYPYQRYARRGLEPFLAKCWGARNFNCQYLTGNIYAEPDQRSVDLALQHLEQFYRVILFENFSECVPAFLTEHQVPFQQVLHERKVKYTEPTAAEKALIERYNHFDIILFKTWKERMLSRSSL